MIDKFRSAIKALAGMVLVLGISLVPMADSTASPSGSSKAGNAKKASAQAKSRPDNKSAGKVARQQPNRVASRAASRATSKAGQKKVMARQGAPAASRERPVAGSGLRASQRRSSAVRLDPPRASFGQIYGLHATDDELDLKSSVALVVDQDTNEVLFSKNSGAVLPIASITKLMTALVVTEAGLPLDELLSVAQDDVDATAGSRSRLQMGTQLSRGEMLHLALMASENRAAHVLGRTYPGGPDAFVVSMNRKARELGMYDTRYVEPTGLSSDNQSSARDLAHLVRAAMQHPIIRDLSTSLEASVPVGRRQVQFHNTNGLVRNPEWEIGLQKTGYIAAAGRCVVMQAELAGRKLIMVLLDSAGKYSRIGDAERLRKWVGETQLGRSLSPSSAATAATLGKHPASGSVGATMPGHLQLR
jgi:serine-type D-Ala-D-Ala endopeptidase (penicillin-binding protein 7)